MCEARVANSSVLVVADVLAVSRSEERKITRGMAQTIKDTEFRQLRLHICAITALQYFIGLFIGGYPCSKKLQNLHNWWNGTTIMVHEFNMIILCIVYFLECSCFLFNEIHSKNYDDA